MQDGHSVTARPMMPFYAHDLFKPYVVYDVSEGRDRTGGHGSTGSGSRWNLGEVNMALALFQELRQYLVQLMAKAARDGTPRPPPVTVGIITPYRCAPPHACAACMVTVGMHGDLLDSRSVTPVNQGQSVVDIEARRAVQGAVPAHAAGVRGRAG